MGLILSMGIFFIVCTVVFLAIALFFPEWLGITGTKARQIMAEHTETKPSQDDKPLP